MRTCVKCGARMPAQDKYINLPGGLKQHPNCVYPTMYHPSRADPGVKVLILQSLSHRRIQTEAEMLLVLEEAKRLLSQDKKSCDALMNLRRSTNARNDSRRPVQ